MMKRIGIISDTHGLLRPEVPAMLKGVDLIIHAGDIGEASIISELEAISPVQAIRGNVDRGETLKRFPATDAFEFDSRYFYVLHDLNELDIDPVAAGFNVVVSGHTHKPMIETRDNVLYINPGSAGPRRFKLPVTLCILTIDESTCSPEILPLVDTQNYPS